MTPENTGGEMSAKQIIQQGRQIFMYLLNRWKAITVVVVVGASIGFGYAFTQKPVYVASLSFVLEDDKSEGGGLSGALGLASSFGFDLGGGAGSAFSSTNLIQLMKSRRIIQQTLLDSVIVDNKVTSLAEMYIDFNNWREAWQKKREETASLHFNPGTDPLHFTRGQDSVMGIMYNLILNNNLAIGQEDKKTSVISITFKSENELFSKLFTEIVAKEVSAFYVETKSKKSQMNVSILERQADSIRTALNNAITDVAVANDNIYNLNPSLNIKRTPSTKRQIDIQANSAILTQLVTNLELAKVSLRKETPLIQIIDAPVLPLKKERVSRRNMALVVAFVFGFLYIMGTVVRIWWKQIMQ